MKTIRLLIYFCSFFLVLNSCTFSQTTDSLRAQKLFWKYSKWTLATVTAGMAGYYFIAKSNNKPADQYLSAATACGGLTALSFIMDAFMNEPESEEIEKEKIESGKRVIAAGVPEIILLDPLPDGKNRIFTDKRKIVIKGRVNNYSESNSLLINEKPVNTDLNHNFSHEITLLDNITLLNIKIRTDGEGMVEKNYVVNYKQESMERNGKDYALLVGIDLYDNWNSLSNPVNDINTIETELRTNYKFLTEKIENSTKNDIYSILRKYAQMQFNEDDQLFLFFAGHGKFDEIFKEGFLVAKDSKREDENNETYISHAILKQRIENIPCKHIFLVIDACFGGALDPLIAQGDSRGDNIYSEITKPEFIKRKLKFKTRKYLTSGGKEYVPDGRPGEHSPFTRKFLEALRSYGGNDGILTLSKINNYIEKVKPEPRFGGFGSDEPGSDFIFIVK